MRRFLPFIFILFLTLKGAVAEQPLAKPLIDGLAVKFKNSTEIKKIKLPASVSATEAIFFLKQNPIVEVAEPNFVYRQTQAEGKVIVNRNAENFFGAFFNPNDPRYAEQWYLRKIQAPGAWEKTTGSLDIKVAILDTGVYWQHPDLIDNIWYNFKEIKNDGLDNDQNGYIDDLSGWDFVENDNDPSPNFTELNATKQGINHGTIVAGVIGAMGNNERGVTGINWRVSMMPLRVLNSHGSGSTIIVEKAIRYALSQGVDIINLSFVGPGYSELLYRAVNDAYAQGVLVVAASGNDSATVQDLDINPLYPVCFTGKNGENIIMGVAASNGLDERAPFSSIGASCIDLTAPGTGFFTTTAFDAASPDALREYYADGWSGTSVAAPVVSGVAALAKSLDKSLTAQDLISLLTKNSENISEQNPGLTGKLGKGRLNAFLVMQAVLERTRAKENGFLRKGSLVLTAGPGEKPYAKAFDLDGAILRETGKILALPESFRSGLSAGVADFNGDGFPELVTMPLERGGPQARIWKSNGQALRSFFAFSSKEKNGLRAAGINLDGGDQDFLVVASPVGQSRLQIYTAEGILFNEFNTFANARYPLNVAVGDLDRDGIDEIVVAPRAGPATVRIFTSQGALLKEFTAYAQGRARGVRLAIADMNGDGWREIVTIPTTGVPEIKLFNNAGRLLTPPWRLPALSKVGDNLIISVDLNNDGAEELIVYSSLDKTKLRILDKTGREVEQISLRFTGFKTIGDMVYVK